MAQKYMYKTYFLRFDEVLNLLECGHKLKRIHWEEGRYISLDNNRKILYLTEPDSIYEVKYLLSNDDILANDWEIVLPPEKNNDITFTEIPED
jgi:hypothetical protein